MTYWIPEIGRAINFIQMPTQMHFHFALCEVHNTSDQESHVTLPPSIGILPFVQSFCCVIFTTIERKLMVVFWLTTTVILTTKNGELEENSTVGGAYMPGEMSRCTSGNNVKLRKWIRLCIQLTW